MERLLKCSEHNIVAPSFAYIGIVPMPRPAELRMLTSSTTSRRTSAWAPDRTRPLCPWPKVARYKGSGDIERAGSFECR